MTPNSDLVGVSCDKINHRRCRRSTVMPIKAKISHRNSLLCVVALSPIFFGFAAEKKSCLFSLENRYRIYMKTILLIKSKLNIHETMAIFLLALSTLLTLARRYIKLNKYNLKINKVKWGEFLRLENYLGLFDYQRTSTQYIKASKMIKYLANQTSSIAIGKTENYTMMLNSSKRLIFPLKKETKTHSARFRCWYVSRRLILIRECVYVYEKLLCNFQTVWYLIMINRQCYATQSAKVYANTVSEK